MTRLLIFLIIAIKIFSYDYTIYNCCYKIDPIKSDIFLKYRCCELIKGSYQFEELDKILKIYMQFYKKTYEGVK